MAKDKLITFRESRKEIGERIQRIHENRLPVVLLLDGVQDVRNVGNIIRTADGARIEKVILYNVAEQFETKKLKRYARNANEYVKYEYLNDLKSLEKMKAEYYFIALDITQKSQIYYEFKVPDMPLLILVGNEQKGISQTVLQLADAAVHLPMLGINLSLNVAVATSIFLYHLVCCTEGGHSPHLRAHRLLEPS